MPLSLLGHAFGGCLVWMVLILTGLFANAQTRHGGVYWYRWYRVYRYGV